jgi:hypothetical protein
MGITHIVLHTGGPVKPKYVASWEGRFANGPRQQIEKVYEGEGIAVYRLLDPPNAAPPGR